MEQNLNIMIVDVLLKGALHARALAKKIGTNHVTVARKLKGLLAQNVLDYRIDGKNKVYFIKKSAEARNWAIIAEAYKLNGALEAYPELRKIVESAQKNPKISLAIFFGSYAKGAARKESDIDLFLETRDKSIKQEFELLNSKLNVKIGNYDRSSDLIKEIEKNHIIAKGAELFYEKNRLFQQAP